MEVWERLQEFMMCREFCSKCGSKNYEVDYVGRGGKYYLNNEELICKDCGVRHTFDDRVSLSDKRRETIEKILK